MSVTSRDIIAWLRWARAGATEAERSQRGARVHAHVYPEGMGFVERAMRDHAVAYAEEMLKDGEPASWEGFPDPRAPGEPEVPVPVMDVPKIADAQETELPRARWQGLVSPESPAYRRASRRDGTGVVAGEMRERARGSPFDAYAPPRRPPRR